MTGLNSELVSIINKGLQNIGNEEIHKILAKWTNLPKHEDRIVLTPAEKAWLAEHPVIRVASDPAFAPLEWLNKNGEFSGLAIDYLREIESHLGVRFEIDKGSTWQELIKKGKSRQVDIFSCVSKTPGREEYLTFTSTYLSFPIKFFTRKAAGYIGSESMLYGRRVAVIKGYYTEEVLQRDHPEIILFPAKTIKDALRMLQDGRVDAFMGDLLTTGHEITRSGFTDIKVGGDTAYKNDLSIAVRKDWPELAAFLNKSLSRIPESRRNQLYQRLFSFLENYNPALLHIDFSIPLELAA
ncbi:MAG: transporter substrate-binding domain-containing protein [Planctomycetota bacterium]|jgi:ABC-type amino acid transport substrate-binding protein